MSEPQNSILWTANPSVLPKNLWRRIEEMGFRVLISEPGDGLLDMIQRTRPNVWVGRANGEGETGFSSLKELRSSFPAMPIILTSSNPSIEEATEAIRAGATEYLPESVDEEKLWAILEDVIQRPASEFGESAPLQPRTRQVARNKPIAFHKDMIKVLNLASRVAPTRSTVLIQGESGTGKEVIARYIHRNSDRSSGPFVAVNCAALPETLLESELFGHEKGAFTGAIGRKKGKFELAQNGTLLLDEISEMAVSVQAKLLRVLQEREVDRVGGQTPIQVDVRVLATTNRDLAEEVKAGNFRQDLYYRLNVVPLHLPPLRRRPEDVVHLAVHFLKESAEQNGLPKKELSQRSEELLKRMEWPGNVRELENLMERAILIVEGNPIEPRDLEFIGGLGGGQATGEERNSIDKVVPLKDMERKMIFQALEDHEGNRTRASKVLGISVRTLRNKLNEYQKEDEIKSVKGGEQG
jgi:two-component system response regulator FlrC